MQVILEPSLKNINLKQHPYLAKTKDTRQFTFPRILLYGSHGSLLLCIEQWT